MDQTDANFEVLIADDGSSDETREAVASLRPPHPIRGPNRLFHTWQPDIGFRASAARNMGVFHSRGDYLIFLDGDCIPRPEFIERHRLLAEPGFMVSGSRVLLSKEFTEQLLSSNESFAIHHKGMTYWLRQRLAGNANKILPLVYLPNHRLRHFRSVKWSRIKSCNLAIWRKDFVAVNGFDESFVGWGHEDADLVLRLARLGVRRKGGAFSTEVFHLWHNENTRDTESENRLRVEERTKTGLIEAAVGLNGHPYPDQRIEQIL
jgi:glycosyltransferase involved in cell wall biosynthesis